MVDQARARRLAKRISQIVASALSIYFLFILIYLYIFK